MYIFCFQNSAGLIIIFLSAVFSYLLAPTKKHEKKGGKADAGKDKHAHVW